ncbi:hypothetical protein MIMGU_mgv1a023080mg, partial [Erythranthe guttata]
PSTLTEYAMNQFSNLDLLDISLLDRFYIPMEFSPTSNGCRSMRPRECNNSCTVFRTNEYCCTNGQRSCGPTGYSRYFKKMCPDAYSYTQNGPTSTFTCPGGTNYTFVFCP